MKEYTLQTMINENEVTVNVKSELNFTESMIFANSILNEVIGSLEGASLIIKDFIIKYNTITHYSDFEMPDDYEEEYDIIYNSNLYESIITNENFNIVRYRKLLEGLDQQIQYEIQKSVNKTKLDDLFEAVTDIIKKFDENIDVVKVSKVIDKILKAKNIDEKVLVETILSLQKLKKKKQVV